MIDFFSDSVFLLYKAISLSRFAITTSSVQVQALVMGHKRLMA